MGSHDSKRGSFEHKFGKFKVGEHFRKRGYWVTFEYKLQGGKSVDLVAEKDGKKIAVEIETGKSVWNYNIQKCLKAGFERIFIIALSDSIEDKIRSSLKYQEEKIIIINLKKFLEDNYKVFS